LASTAKKTHFLSIRTAKQDVTKIAAFRAWRIEKIARH
jgi:hypothetical protein